MAKKYKPLRYFYLNGQLHKKLHINRPADELTAWCYPTKRRVTYPYKDARQRMETAFTTQEVSKMMGRGIRSLENAILRGDIEMPQFTYGLNEHMKKFKYMWHESNIMEAHAFFTQRHRGRPRKDGTVTPMRGLPSARELRAMIRNEEILYVKVGDEFVPTWRAPDI